MYLCRGSNETRLIEEATEASSASSASPDAAAAAVDSAAVAAAAREAPEAAGAAASLSLASAAVASSARTILREAVSVRSSVESDAGSSSVGTMDPGSSSIVAAAVSIEPDAAAMGGSSRGSELIARKEEGQWTGATKGAQR